ncbi:MAG: hypothetical protein H0U53_10880 [Actinobacteria bacterium]|nr:hypothetical protein [Actinomycetota bacterium]
MAMTQAQILIDFEEEVGEAFGAVSDADVIRWFNLGQSRLRRKYEKVAEIVWTAALRSVALPTDYLGFGRLTVNAGISPEPWYVFGDTLILQDPGGASSAGGARLHYYSEWPNVTAAAPSQLTTVEDQACMNFALHRFFKKLLSNHSHYARFAALVGQETMEREWMKQESDRYYQDFLDARDDTPSLPPAFFYEG